jgi:ornithine cyclodeaminase/alanine dehydrogenase-like protein (mu-crystallin family)
LALSGSVRPFHALEHRCRQLDHPDSVALFGSHANRNAASLGEWIGNNFKILAVKANALADTVPERGVSAKRTAASAALASQFLASGDLSTVGLIGCGPINFEVFRFLNVLHPNIKTLFLFDLDRSRAREFSERCQHAYPELTTILSTGASEPLSASGLIPFATTARTPYIAPASLRPGSCVLHL